MTGDRQSMACRQWNSEPLGLCFSVETAQRYIILHTYAHQSLEVARTSCGQPIIAEVPRHPTNTSPMPNNYVQILQYLAVLR